MVLFYLGSTNVLQGWGELGWATTTKMGPNDASGVVWALGTCIFLLRVFLFSN